jgi:hypothetical protein
MSGTFVVGGVSAGGVEETWGEARGGGSRERGGGRASGGGVEKAVGGSGERWGGRESGGGVGRAVGGSEKRGGCRKSAPAVPGGNGRAGDVRSMGEDADTRSRCSASGLSMGALPWSSLS